MRFILFSSLLLVASASGSPLNALSRDGENTSPTTNVTSPFVKVRDVCVATARKYYTPAVVLVSTYKQVLRCLQEDPNQCEVWYTTNSWVHSLLVVGEFIYAGLEGKILRCNLNLAESCEIYQTGNITDVQSLATGNGYLYAGLEKGRVLICKLDEFNSCQLWNEFESSVYALMVVNEYIYVGLWDGEVMRCPLGMNGSCTLKYILTTGITGFANAGNSIFAVALQDDYMWKCDRESYSTDSCKSVRIVVSPSDMAFFDGVLYVASNYNRIYTCQPADNPNCTKYGNLSGIISIAFSYATCEMLSRYRNEDTGCPWQRKSQCPPVVTYYNARQRAMFEVHVKDGKLHNTQGTLVDTSDADEGHSGPAAIFAMGPDGKILLSTLHKNGLLHTSSFFAGKPVAGAGEMVVKNGKIREIRACSEHYLPDTVLNRQVIQSLKAQGYTYHIKSVMCNESDYILSESNGQ